MTNRLSFSPAYSRSRTPERLAESRWLAVAGGVLLTLAMIPGLPKVALTLIGSVLGLAAQRGTAPNRVRALWGKAARPR